MSLNLLKSYSYSLKKRASRYSLFLLLCLCWLGIVAPIAEASHLAGMNITYTYLGSNQYRIRLSFYRDCSGIFPSTTEYLTISNDCGLSGPGVPTSLTLNQVGTAVEVTSSCPGATTSCAGGSAYGVEEWIYEGVVTLPATPCGSGPGTGWTFYNYDCCRNSTITTGAADAYWYVAATLNTATAAGNNSPTYTIPPILRACLNQPFTFNVGAFDADGDSLAFSIVCPMATPTTPVTYTGGYSCTSPIPGTTPVTPTIDALGNVTFTPTAIGITVMAIQVREFRLIGGVMTHIGTTVRDVQVQVSNCTNSIPTTTGITGVTGGTQTGSTVTICAGQTVTINFTATDPNVGQIVTISPPANFSTLYPGATFTGTPGLPATATFTWTPPLASAGMNILALTAADNACPSMQTVTAFNIQVLSGITVVPNVTVYCGISQQLQALGASAYSWSQVSGPAGGLSYFSCTACPNPQVGGPGMPNGTYVFRATATSGLPAGCAPFGDVTVTVTDGYTLTMPPNATICSGGSGVVLNPTITPAQPGATYAWSPSAGLSSATVLNPTANPTVTTTYTLTVTNASGCVRTGNVTVTVNPPIPTITANATPLVVCAGSPTNLSSTLSGFSGGYNISSIPATATPPAGGTWTNVTGLLDDNFVGPFSLPFSFDFYGISYSDFYIGSNGYISFGGGYSTLMPQTIPDANTPNNIIAYCWDDLNPGAGGVVRYKTIGVVGSRQFIISFENVLHYASSNTVTAFIILYEGSNDIDINVVSQNDVGVHTLGIENGTGTLASSPVGFNNVSWTVSTPIAYRFSIPMSSYVINWTSNPPGFTSTLQNPGSVTPTVTTTYTVNITGGGCTNSSSVTVEVVDVDAGPDLSLCPGASVTLNPILSGPATSAPTVCGLSATTCAGGTNSNKIGTGTTSNDGYSYPTPFANWYWGTRQQYLYLASELVAAGMTSGCQIKNIQFNVLAVNSCPTLQNFQVRMGCTALSALTSTFVTAGMVTVRASANYTPVAGWNTITLTTPYDWDGSSNLIVEICSNNTSWLSNGNASVEWTNPAFAGANVVHRADNANNCTNLTGTVGSARPNIRFNYCSNAISWSWSSSNGGTFAPSASVQNPTFTAAGLPTTLTVTINNGSCTRSDNLVITPGSPTAVTWVGGSGIGAQRNDWFRVQNWNPTCLPDCNTDVTIPNVPFKPVINGAATAGARDLTILTGSDLTLGVTGKLNICRHWTQAGTATLTASTSSRVNFVGTGNQNYSRGSGVGLFGRVALNNGSTLTLVDNHLAAADSITFEGGKGRFVTNAHQVQLLNTGTGRIAGHGISPNGYVQGNFRQNVVTAAGAYDFPVGDVPEPAGKGYQLARIQFSGVGVGTGANQAAYLAGRFDPYAAVPGSDPAILVACPSVTAMPMLDNGYWTINSFNSSNVQVTATGVYNYDVTMFPRNYTNPMPFAQAARNQLLAMGSGTCQPGASVSHTRSSMTGFSEFGVAQSQTPLPVELLDLQARALSNSILVSWQTRSELNCRGFEVQRSVDNWHYESIGWVEGAGTSSVVNSYRLEDTRVVANQRYYYRILQVDYDGSSRLSNVVEAQLGDGIVFGVTAYPNPVNNVLTVKIVSPADELLQVRLYNSLGQSVIQKTGRTVNGVETVVMEMNGLSSGLYQLEVSSANGKAVQQIIKQ